MWYRDFFPRSRPRKAKGGIKAESKRGAFGKSWWAQRWIKVLESFDIGARLGRGRSYARGGQVLSIDVKQGKVTAKVQGSRPQPYAVSIEVKVLKAEEWKKLAEVLSRQAIFLAKLLAGEMPQDVEQAFKDAGLSLFPEKLRDLSTECSCPDYSNPCKHIAAVYYLLGEEFDRDPFLLFRLRGLERDKLMGMLSPPRQNRWRRTPGCSGKARLRSRQKRATCSVTYSNRRWPPPCRNASASSRFGAARRTCSTPSLRCTTPLRRRVWASSLATKLLHRGRDSLAQVIAVRTF